MLKMWIYIISISLQIAGALMLLLFSISVKRGNVIRRFCANGIITADSNTKKIDYKKETFIEEFRKAYLSKISFICIATGYILGVFGDIGNKQREIAIWIFIVTTFIIIISYFVVGMLIKHNKSVNKEITISELEELGIQVDITDISYAEIDKMFKKTQ